MKFTIMLAILFDLLAKRKVTAVYLAEKHEISPRTVYRYIDLLSLNVPIHIKRGRNGGICISDSYKLPMGFMTIEEYDAAIEALENGDEAVAAMKEEYDMRRRLIVAGFNRIGLTCREPKGAFYAFPSIASTGLSSDDFCERLLYAEHVAVVPGTAFGQGGEGFIRASYCYSTEHIKEALRRIERFLKTL